MRLKSLQLLGFKTFADRTRIEIDSDLTAIVGPNGSGKSNLVDAVLWVLGEQNPRTLRGTASQDVIFAGSSTRKPLGMAEVRLTIDNTDGGLPISFAEVAIARRVFRSGEASYLINGAQCRLRDITDLFLDTGIGKNAYAFVGQTEIDAVLSARPEDRRELFDEAAGIKKYRARKEEALRKLEAAEANIARVNDILQEIESRRVRLERDAQEAKRFLDMRDRLRAIEVDLLVAEVQQPAHALAALRHQRAEQQQAHLRLDAEQARLERELSRVGDDLAKAEAEMETARLAHQSALSGLERAEARLAVLATRTELTAETAHRLTRDVAEIDADVERLRASTAATESDLRAVEDQVAAHRQERAGLLEEVAAAEAALTDARRAADECYALQMRRAQREAERAAHLTATRRALGEARDRCAQADAERVTATAARDAARDRCAELRHSLESARTTHEGFSDQRAQLEQERRDADAALAATTKELDAAELGRTNHAARLAALTDLEQAYAGLQAGARAVLAAHSSGKLHGVRGAVLSLVRAPEAYRVAIDAALGSALETIVTDTEDDAASALNWLKDSGAGRAGFIPRMRACARRASPPARLRAATGYIGMASELVQTAPEYADLAHRLLGRTVIVTDLHAARAIAREHASWESIVTLGGDLLRADGSMTGGISDSPISEVRRRAAERDELALQVSAAAASVSRLQAIVSAAEAARATIQARCDAMTGQDSDLRAGMARDESALVAAVREVERSEQHLRQITESRAAAEEAIARLTGEAQALWPSSEDETAAGDDRAAVDAHRDRVIALECERDDCRSRAAAAETEIKRLTERASGLTRASEDARSALASRQSQSEARRAQLATWEAQSADTDTERQAALRALDRERTRLDRTAAKLSSWRETRQKLLATSFELTGAVKSTSQERAELMRDLHSCELRIAKLEIQLASASARLEAEYGIVQDVALARNPPVPVDRHDAQEAARLRNGVRNLQDVNTGAIAEFDELTQRSGFLGTQLADLYAGRDGLTRTIEGIDGSTRDVFLATFQSVSEEFDRLFKRLFEGGSTRLVLTDEAHLLSTGVDIVAAPPGKRPQRLSLLSGGERALTAIALLFAFLSVKPSPFVVLDEVDAPLDGANVERFVRLLQEFSARSQFLVVTHNAATMEAAPIWYGVSMREPGVSAVLSYRVPETSPLSEPAPETSLAAVRG